MTQTATVTPAASTLPPPPQRLRALERANEVRLARAELKRRIAIGEVTAAEVILLRPWESRSWAVGELLMSQRRWGRSRCQKFLARNQISEVKSIGALTERQRRLLAAQLECDAAVAEIEARMQAAEPCADRAEIEPDAVAVRELESEEQDVSSSERYALAGVA